MGLHLGGSTIAQLNNAFARAPIDPRQPTFGAAWDGTTDDTVALRAAAAAAIAQGRPLLIPKGTGLVGQVNSDGHIIPLTAGLTIVAEAGHRSIVKVKDGTGDYLAVFGCLSTNSLDGLLFDGFTIDQNNAGNPATFAGLATQGRVALLGFTTAATDLRVQNMLFKGFDSINVVSINGALADDVQIVNNAFVMAASTTTAHDHSSIYVSAKSMRVTGNRLYGVSGGAGSLTAIETHGGDQIVTQNIIRGYYTGGNITGIRADASDNVIWSKNVIDSANLGLVLWSGGTGTGLANCSVIDNKITLDRDAWVGRSSTAYTVGISLDVNGTKNFTNLTIDNNTIVFKAFSAAALVGEYQSPGIALWLSTAAIFNLSVTKNTIIGALGAGIRLSAPVTRGRITSNEIIDCGSSTEAALAAAWRSGIVVDNTQIDLQIDRNRFFDTRGTHKMLQGIYASSITAVTRCSQASNTITAYDGTALPLIVQNTSKAFTSSDVGIPLGSRFTTSQYYGPEGARQAVAAVNGTATAAPFWVTQQQAFDRIGAQVTVAGAASTVVRLGIYADNGFGRPGALVLDAGTIAGDAVASAELTIAQTLSAGLYWLAVAPIGGGPTMVCVSGNIIGAGVSSLAVATSTTPRAGYSMTGVTGALPATFTVAGQTSAPTVVAMRAA